MFRCKQVALCVALFDTASSSAQMAVAPAVISANYGNARTNVNLSETNLTPTSVAGGAFGKIGSFPVDGQIYAQPLYVAGLAIPGQGTRNVVFVATMNNSVYAIDADAPAATTPIWQVNLGPPAQTAEIPNLNDVSPLIGVLSTPVIDPNGQVIYVVAETFENGEPLFRLHGLSLLNGQETQNGPVVIAATIAGTGGGASATGIVSFDAFWHLQRPGLALANGAVYVAFASHSDAGDYHGWLMAYSAKNLQQQIAVFNATPNGNGGGIWQSGRAPAVDSSGNIFVATGNGDFDGQSNFSGVILKLSGADLSVLDWYTQAAWQYLNANDLDVGSTGPILSNGTNPLVTGDKGGRLINLNAASLGHVETSRGADGFQVSTSGIFNLALWQTDQGTLLYQHDLNGFLKAYSVTPAGIVQTPVSTGTWKGDSWYQGMAVSSNGSSNGILWETTGNHALPGTPATLHAWNASDLTQEIWNSDLNPADVLGSFAKFVAPLVANGRVYVPTFSGQLVIYGLQSSVPDQTAPQIASVFNAGSLIDTPVSPGELVSIFGTNLGAAIPPTFELDTDGQVPTLLGGTQVLFDGVPAPLLYSSANQIELVVPFEVAPPNTQMVLRNAAGQFAAASLPVSVASPALITASELGTGQISALNQDGSANSVLNPASVNSVVAIYATGLGQTTPVGSDGTIAGAILPVPSLPVSVQIGGLPAYVLYAGAAPRTVEGVFQINVRIPPLVETGSYIPVVLHTGYFASQTNVWIAIANEQ